MGGGQKLDAGVAAARCERLGQELTPIIRHRYQKLSRDYHPDRVARRGIDGAAQQVLTKKCACRRHAPLPHRAHLAAAGWVRRGYSGQYSGFQTVIVLYGLPILK